MCTLSMVVDDWRDRWPRPEQGWLTQPIITTTGGVTQEEFDDFKKEMKKELEALKKLMKAAKIYDEETGQPDCEKAEAIEAIKKLAEIAEVDLEDIFPNESS